LPADKAKSLSNNEWLTVFHSAGPRMLRTEMHASRGPGRIEREAPSRQRAWVFSRAMAFDIPLWRCSRLIHKVAKTTRATGLSRLLATGVLSIRTCQKFEAASTALPAGSPRPLHALIDSGCACVVFRKNFRQWDMNSSSAPAHRRRRGRDASHGFPVLRLEDQQVGRPRFRL